VWRWTMDAPSVAGFGFESGLKPDSVPTRRSGLIGSAEGNPGGRRTVAASERHLGVPAGMRKAPVEMRAATGWRRISAAFERGAERPLVSRYAATSDRIPGSSTGLVRAPRARPRTVNLANLTSAGRGVAPLAASEKPCAIRSLT
jgi:hypothetical protein